MSVQHLAETTWLRAYHPQSHEIIFKFLLTLEVLPFDTNAKLVV